MTNHQSQAKHVDTLLKKALRYLNYRARSRGEIRLYLKKKLKKEQPNTLIDTVMEKLEEFNLLNDKDFAAQYTQSLLRKGKGPRFIKLKLRHLHVPNYVISETINQLTQEELITSANRIGQKRLNKLMQQEKNKPFLRLKKYLYSRGFYNQTINAVIDDLRLQQ